MNPPIGAIEDRRIAGSQDRRIAGSEGLAGKAKSQTSIRASSIETCWSGCSRFSKVDQRLLQTPRLRVTLRVGNEFEGKMHEMVHEADTLSSLVAEQEATKTARKKFRFVEVISVKSM
ncbi:hypothetical protein SOP85_21400 [Pseudomonas sp. YuFO20]|uniref:hypothetical protein n=1 Tax=Pseudomonas sp. YuFO20 TaxID=3095362 RepID=UPI002B244C5B|nr:hypothetical protein [Pseudomonas sp. YuFO20]MEB2517969.1 hypothetical protein [Pseudomonas sp. YuFO20]